MTIGEQEDEAAFREWARRYMGGKYGFGDMYTRMRDAYQAGLRRGREMPRKETP